ncbi:ribosome maturation factor RimM [Actinoallomurus iriomotensis]|jgi:16S rRNA processing protein RimM|uniref:Ribosome maturation factor RimM n=1 Tax=Actinoallomurus iriomotensis TaxID=478107 RepID=A0A9W6VNK5_9ACTN|nr:ribosome maturation factor RimM [Actinoallomurus iriomotensis]GLY72621.1 ribosome maturation factor RimM [Actinoallomurus iriomotensis]GLY84108.1 ribosome maturation factor RimM [Actinoallomurus iriomotensis]
MLLAVGRIGRAHGVRGEVSVDVRTDDPAARFAPGAALGTENAGTLTVETVRTHAGRLLVRFAGIEDRTAAEELRGLLLLVDSTEIPPSGDPEEFHDHELIGLAAVATDGTALGEIVDVEHHGQDLLVLRRPSGDDALVPFVSAIVPTVDVPAGRVVLDPPAGLLD